VMAAPTIHVSAEEHLGDPINIRMDIIHPEPDAAITFLTAVVVRTQAQHEEAIRGIHEQLLGKMKTKSLIFPEHAIGKSTRLQFRRCLHLLLGRPDAIYMGRTDP
nr:hypothetical protein [Tanacetum cinerariifolium]